MTQASKSPDDSPDFSLVLGGPLYQIFLRTRLAHGSLKSLSRRILAFSLLTWLPLVPLTIISKGAWSGVGVPFLVDIDVHMRLLVALPLLIGAEWIVHERIRFVIGQFFDRNIITGEEELRFRGILHSTIKLRNSIWVEVFLVILVCTAGPFIWRHASSLGIATWYDRPAEGRLHLTPAGYWYALVSIPIFQFILLRWYFRIALWYRLLWKVSRLKLNLIVTHPDLAGGLNFLGSSAYAFVPIFLAHSFLFASVIANHIWHEGGQLPAFELEILGFILFFLLVIFTPTTFFCQQLWRTKLEGMQGFGAFSMEYVREFQRKWLEGSHRDRESALGSDDIQSLADLANSFEVTRKMGMVPFNHETVIRVAIILALPFVPLTLTMIPLDKMIDRILGMLL